MKKRFIIISFLVLLLLIITQIIWVVQVAERDKTRFRDELNILIENIVKQQATKQIFEEFEIDLESPSITLMKANPDSLSQNARSYGSYETDPAQSSETISSFLEDAMTEMLFEEVDLDLQAISTLFQNRFSNYEELSYYSFVIKENDTNIDSLYSGLNSFKNLADITKGVYIELPLGTSGTYEFVAQFIFKATAATKRMSILVILSAVAIVAVAAILIIFLIQINIHINRLDSHEKKVIGIVHDLKSPLSYIYFMLGIIEMKDKSDFIKEGKDRVKSLSDNIEHILSEIKMNNKNISLKQESFNLEEQCHEILNELKVIYNNKNITVNYNIKPEASTLIVDPSFFNSCLRNLFDNAIKYSGDNPVINISSRKDRNRILITVSDNGKGISKNDKNKIFNNFFRSNNTSEVDGHGIGLSTVNQIVKSHKGNIKVISEPGKGSSFTINIPYLNLKE